MDRLVTLLPSPHRLRALLRQMAGVRVAVIGDFALDVYWDLDASRAEYSLETGRLTRPVRSMRCSPGGAGNVAALLAVLGCKRVLTIGVIGADPWGTELKRCLEEFKGMDTSGLVIQPMDWVTPAYIKPIEKGVETRRFDFGLWNRLAPATLSLLEDHCRRAATSCDVLLVNEQIRPGLHQPPFCAGLKKIMAAFPGVSWLYDGRHRPERYGGLAALKMNEQAAREMVRRMAHGRFKGIPRRPEDVVMHIVERYGKPLLLTRGSRGVIVGSCDGWCSIPAVPPPGPCDPVGAGDAAFAAFGIALGAGAEPVEAAAVANWAGAVTVRKVGCTGTATPAEICAVAREARIEK